MKPRFLLDQHIGRAIQRQLYRLAPEIEVLRVGDAGAPPLGTQDPDILNWLEENDYTLVTENRKTMPVHLLDHFAEGKHIPGVFLVRPDVNIGRLIEELYLIWFASTAEEYRDCVLFIPM